ncbi:MAG: DUF692 family protein [Deltaproteobacteria bacterium]|nr:DUF692 family protein [Deltaproteobacteria bacterium]
MSFSERVAALPRLGIGVSTEFGAGNTPAVLVARGQVDFVEVGADLERGVDDAVRAHVAAGGRTTWHFLDVNLEDPADRDDRWADEVAASARAVGAAWLCGDAGRWRIGPRDRGHGVLLPPILCAESAAALADGVTWLRERSGLDVLPENPPGQVWIGPWDVLRYFAEVADRADCGLLLDVSHLAIHRRATGRGPLDGLDDFPLDRVVEVHVAGSAPRLREGRWFAEDDHGPDPLPETWEILARVVAGARNLRAVVVECERNPPDVAAALIARVREACA